jgi:hypothetical protein
MERTVCGATRPRYDGNHNFQLRHGVRPGTVGPVVVLHARYYLYCYWKNERRRSPDPSEISNASLLTRLETRVVLGPIVYFRHRN